MSRIFIPMRDSAQYNRLYSNDNNTRTFNTHRFAFVVTTTTVTTYNWRTVEVKGRFVIGKRWAEVPRGI
jgi:hypothetical protein